ncbi:hypothetical protein CAPTEDRAFT_153490 [Capitella teleta]|uniref:Large ribosomal subunit protein mL40 n=1 Tax=Capitella teleta TaxID=283909 RepID=R7UEK9_CAPTE|nr:hypothetical protein CAPTEDRAFT_153490 [Capitella teleta]|eukprot:ELU04409.1 hypothetical protein CAPTEDRAFT_153490 [Capitella teleta]
MQSALGFHATSFLSASPMKKKRVELDPNKAKKRIRKIEKAIRKLESKGRKFKPINEIEGDRSVLRTQSSRLRETEALSFDEAESRALLIKRWSRFKWRQLFLEEQAIKSAMDSQAEALRQLKEISPSLYDSAIQIDEGLLPFSRKGPTETPPLKGHVYIDGEYLDTTEKYDK